MWFGGAYDTAQIRLSLRLPNALRYGRLGVCVGEVVSNVMQPAKRRKGIEEEKHICICMYVQCRTKKITADDA